MSLSSTPRSKPIPGAMTGKGSFPQPCSTCFCCSPSPSQAQGRGTLCMYALPVTVAHSPLGWASGEGGQGGGRRSLWWGWDKKGKRQEALCSSGAGPWHPGGVFLPNCLSSTAVIINKKLKSILTPDPWPSSCSPHSYPGVLPSALSARCSGRMSPHLHQPTLLGCCGRHRGVLD